MATHQWTQQGRRDRAIDDSTRRGPCHHQAPPGHGQRDIQLPQQTEYPTLGLSLEPILVGHIEFKELPQAAVLILLPHPTGNTVRIAQVIVISRRMVGEQPIPKCRVNFDNGRMAFRNIPSVEGPEVNGYACIEQCLANMQQPRKPGMSGRCHLSLHGNGVEVEHPRGTRYLIVR